MEIVVKILMGLTIGLLLGQQDFEQIFRETRESKGDE